MGLQLKSSQYAAEQINQARANAYVEIVRRIRRGEFDEQFREAGVAKPDL